MPKLLGDFLLEHQEAFALDIYLVERGYSKRTTSGFKNRARFCKLSTSRWLRKKRDVVPNCTEFARAVFSRLILHNDIDKIKNGTRDGGQKDEYADRKVDADRKLKWRLMMQDSYNKQLSPVSVLEETESDEGSSPLHDKNYNFNNTTLQGESSTPIPQCRSKQPTHIYNVRDGSNPYDQYIINKRALRQTKQLLMDCVRELVEKHRERDDKSGKQFKKILGTEELWKHVCENVWLWSQDSIHESNIIHLLNYDFMTSEEEWGSHTMLHKEEISREIGDAIFESFICECFS